MICSRWQRANSARPLTSYSQPYTFYLLPFTFYLTHFTYLTFTVYLLPYTLHFPPFTFCLLPYTLHLPPFAFTYLTFSLFLFIIIVIIEKDSIVFDQLYKSKSTPFASALIFVILISDCVICVICVAWPNFVFVLFCSLYNWWSVIVMASPLSFCIFIFLSFGNFILFFIFS